jgi:NAD(P)H-dependent FMN reductase
MKLVLDVMTASTRDKRTGWAIAEWFTATARRHDLFDVELVDLKSVDLPLFDESTHPRLQRYEHAHTRAWSDIVRRADAFVFVTPEYNHGAPPSLVNALDFLYVEWAYKPAGFVSYGGVSGGTRSVQMTKPILTALKVMPIPEAVTIPFVATLVDNGVFQGGDAYEKAAAAMLNELRRWAAALKPLRTSG